MSSRPARTSLPAIAGGTPVRATPLPFFRAAIDEAFAPTLERPAIVDGLALFVEPEPGAPSLVKSWYRLGRRRERKTA